MKKKTDWETIYDLLDSDLMESLTTEQYHAIENFVCGILLPKEKKRGIKEGRRKLLEELGVAETWDEFEKIGKKENDTSVIHL